MIELKYKQFGHGSVKESQKIYYCCAPGDHDIYFDSIAVSLSSCYPNIAFFYPGDKGRADDSVSSEERKDHLFDLAQMNLFVIPVTRRFLTEENRARNEEFPFAAEHHIPVLPILEETGLENLFNERCGNLQCLSVVGEDSTELPFETKLKSFLDTVLLGNETLEKIRASFGGYIFLSYRKKDRAYAQKVMRLIHRNPSCRDAAIWYDEFLTPGEDFNDSIKRAFERSSLFALVVTPHILEEGNYVMEQEYPMALEAGRSIMPVVAVDTDENELERSYPNLPERWNCSDEYAEMIADKVKNELGLSFNDDAEHRYYIGLAYLLGVDLETDPDKAFSLITSAAEDGVEEAYQKLVDMYKTGTGVERDYYEAAKWSQRYADHLEKKLTDEKNDSDKQRYVRACLEAGKNWEFVLEKKKALAAYEKSLSGEMAADNIASYVYQMEACYDAVLLAEKMHETKLAELLCDRYFQAARYFSAAEIYKSRAEELAGNLAYRAGKWGEAIVHFEKGLELNEKMSEKNSDLLYFKHLTAQFYMFLGSSYLRLGADVDGAGIIDYFERALNLFEELADRQFAGTQESRMLICYSLLQISKERNDYDSVRKYARKSFDLSLAKDQKENSLYSKRAVRDALEVFAESQELPGGDYNAAEFLLKTAASYSKNIVLMAGRPMGLSEQQLSWVCAQAQIPYYTKIIALLTENRDKRKAKEYKKELKILEKIPNPTPSDERLRSAADSAAERAKTPYNEPSQENTAGLEPFESDDPDSLSHSYDRFCLLAREHEKNEQYTSERNRIEVLLADSSYERGMKGDLKMLERAWIMNEALALRLPYPENCTCLQRADDAAFLLADRYMEEADIGDKTGATAGKKADLYLRAYEAYKDLLEEDPDEKELDEKSCDAARKAARFCYERALAGEPMRMIRAYELYSMLSDRFPADAEFRKRKIELEHKVAFLFYKWGKTDFRYMQLSLIYYRRIHEREPNNETVKKNISAIEKIVAKHKVVQFMKGNSAEKRQMEGIIEGIVGQKVQMKDVDIQFKSLF